jgi:hypothetical protein
MESSRERAKRSKYGCGKLIAGVCYYCYGKSAYGLSHPYIFQQERSAAEGYHCGDAGGFSSPLDPGRLCLECAVKAGLLW